MAGLHVRLFAGRNAGQGARPGAGRRGDAGSDGQAGGGAAFAGQFVSAFAGWRPGARAWAVAPLAGALGDKIGLPPVAKAEKRRAFADPGHNRWAAAEVDPVALPTPPKPGPPAPLDPNWPVAVVLTGDGRQRPARHAIQTAPADASRHGVVIHVPGANHASLLGERHAGHIVRAILAVEAAAKA